MSSAGSEISVIPNRHEKCTLRQKREDIKAIRRKRSAKTPCSIGRGRSDRWMC